MTNKPEKQTSRYYISRHHRLACELLLNRMKEIQAESNEYKQIAGLCVAVITSTVSYIESFINEFISGLIEFGPYEQDISSEKKARLVAISQSFDWKYKLSPLEKYQYAISSLGFDKFELGKEPHQSAAILIQFRNHLVHYEPIDTEITFPSGERTSVPKLERKITSKIGDTPYKGLQEYFPENCLHYGCADWAVSSSKEYVKAFLLRVGARTTDFIMTGSSE